MAKTEGRKAPVSAMLVHHHQVCTGCGLCDLMCSLYHEGEQGQSLSRGELTGNRLTTEFTFNVCHQCASPKCYDACPHQDKALCIDETTGKKYINPGSLGETVGREGAPSPTSHSNHGTSNLGDPSFPGGE